MTAGQGKRRTLSKSKTMSNLNAPELYLNRELAQLEFNARVLAQAAGLNITMAMETPDTVAVTAVPLEATAAA